MTAAMAWHFKPKSPRNGYITDERILLRKFDFIIKNGERFSKFQASISRGLINKLRKSRDFKFCNVYDQADRVQVLSFTKTKITWHVKRIKSFS